MKNWLPLLALLLLGACARANTTMLDDRTAIISGRGSASNSQADVTKKVLQEAAQQAVTRGYAYFQVTGGQDQSRAGTMIIPGQSTTTGNGMASCYGGVCNGNYSSQTYTSPGMAMGFAKPGADIYVRFYKAGEIDPKTPGVWDAQRVLAVAASE